MGMMMFMSGQIGFKFRSSIVHVPFELFSSSVGSGVAKSACSACRRSEPLDVFHQVPVDPVIPGYDELGHPFAIFNGEGDLAMVDEDHADITAVVCVDGSRAVEHGDPMFEGQATSWPDLGFKAGRQGQMKSRGNQGTLPGLKDLGCVELGP
jgi:hypothetical protein